MVLTVNTAILSICCKMLLQYSVFQMRPESSISRDNNVDVESKVQKLQGIFPWEFPQGISQYTISIIASFGLEASLS